MSFLRPSLRLSFAILLGTPLAACATHAGATLPPAWSGIAPQSALPDLAPPKCKGQKNTKSYASLTVTLSTAGGSFCIPEYGGFGGTIQYPPANPSVKLKLISSTKNYAIRRNSGKGMRSSTSSSAISGGTTFGNNVNAGGGLTSKQIAAGKPYTAYGQAVFSGFKFNSGLATPSQRKASTAASSAVSERS